MDHGIDRRPALAGLVFVEAEVKRERVERLAGIREVGVDRGHTRHVERG